MKNSSPDFPQLIQRHLDLLKELKAEIENLATLSSVDPEVTIIRKRIDELSVKALRQFALKNSPAESRHPRFVYDSHGKYSGVLPGLCKFHPDIPSWAVKHFREWIPMLPLHRYDAHEVLRETGIVGIETGMKRPEESDDIERCELIKQRVLEIRGVPSEECEDDYPDLIPAGSPALLIESKSLQGQAPPYTLLSFDKSCRIE